MAKITGKVIGVLYVLLGLMGFALGDQANGYHNLLHLATGVIGVYVGFVGSSSAARRFCLAFGVGYLALGALGFVLGNPAMEYLWAIGPLSVSMPDHIHHLLLGTILLAGGVLPRVGFRRRGGPPIPEGVSPARSGR
jgi:hypothetical protein